MTVAAHDDTIGARFDAARDAIEGVLSSMGVRLAYLFGSVARGAEGRDSDLDVAVLFDEALSEDERTRRRIDLTTELVGLVHVNDVDVVVLNDAPPLLAQVVITEGRPIFGGKVERVRFEIATTREYIDTQWIRDHYARELERKHRGPRTLPEGKGEW